MTLTYSGSDVRTLWSSLGFVEGPGLSIQAPSSLDSGSFRGLLRDGLELHGARFRSIGV